MKGKLCVIDLSSLHHYIGDGDLDSPNSYKYERDSYKEPIREAEEQFFCKRTVKYSVIRD